MTAATDFESDQPRPIRIGTPLVLLLVLLALLMGGLLTFAVRGQDQVAREAARTIAQAAFNAERDGLENLVRDYSWWNASVENLIFELNPEWIPENLDWMVENFGVSRIFVLGPDRTPVYASLNAEPVAKQDPAWQVPLFRALVARARSLPEEPGASLSAYVTFDDGVHLAAASKLLQESDTSEHPPYPDKGILIVTKKIDDAFLDAIRTKFRLAGLELRAGGQADAHSAALALNGPRGETVALASWPPPQPGTKLLQGLILPLVIAFALVGGLMAVIAARARRASLALQRAFDARVAAQQELEYAARHDPLTDLPNRALFLEHLASAIAHGERYGSSFTVHYLDLDGFKHVNDTFGHPAGDQLLRGLANRLTGIVRAADIAARFGGDEFAVLQRGSGDQKDAGLLADRMIRAVQKPFEINGHSVHVTLSVGIAFDTGGGDPEEIVRKADRALYRAKANGGCCFEFYVAALDNSAIQKVAGKRRQPSHATGDE